MDNRELMVLAAELRGAERRGAGTAGRSYPMVLRKRVVAAARDCRAAGGSLKDVAETVGISGVTLWAWAKADRSATFQQVQLRAPQVEGNDGTRRTAASPETSRTPMESGIRVTGPGGLQIEGLSIASLADLVRRLS